MILSVLCPHGGIKALDTRKQNERRTDSQGKFASIWMQRIVLTMPPWGHRKGSKETRLLKQIRGCGKVFLMPPWGHECR